MRVLLGVSGGVAAYKAVYLLRLLREAGHQVRVIPTQAALKFVGAPTWEAISGEPVTAEVFSDNPGQHVSLGQNADLVIVAPATADLLARAAAGRADDLLTTTLLMARCPVVMAPAMHTEMWLHAATKANVATLRARGVHIIEPASGRLTGKDSGPGRLPEPEEIFAAAMTVLAERTGNPATARRVTSGSETDPLRHPAHCDSAQHRLREADHLCHPARSEAKSQDLLGLHVVVSAGGTREPIDPVRWIGNRSTGRQGIELAAAARARGAYVALVAANLEAAGANVAADVVVPVETAAELREAVRAAARDADVVVMAAAVADYRPVKSAEAKIKKQPGVAPSAIELVENPDILAELVREPLRPGQTIVGFAAETGDDVGSVLEHGRAKAIRKGATLLAVNAVGAGLGFGTATNEVWVLDATGAERAHVAGTKREVADAIWDTVLDVRGEA